MGSETCYINIENALLFKGKNWIIFLLTLKKEREENTGERKRGGPLSGYTRILEAFVLSEGNGSHRLGKGFTFKCFHLYI